MKAYPTLDKVGIGLSSLCVLHCLALPVFASSLPVFAVLSEMEWLHKALVLFAVPVAGIVIIKSRLPLQIIAALGISLLLAAAFLPQFHDIETLGTVLGASLLGSAHLWRLFSKSHTHHGDMTSH